MPKKYVGINIQFPISQLILDGTKTVETRTYPIPPAYLGEEMLLVETPGPTGKFKSRIRAIIKFNECFQYKSKSHFAKDVKRHAVEPGTIWDWENDKPKWGWVVEVVKKVEIDFPSRKKKGIRFTKDLAF
ncbi:MAG: hypothetical protein IPL83_09880 [Bdellovibrionales bacterium]|nr:hypothetical protein [Bdellovibrionales bacterium]